MDAGSVGVRCGSYELMGYEKFDEGDIVGTSFRSFLPRSSRFAMLVMVRTAQGVEL